MRSMAGLATLAAQHGGVLKSATALLAAGEMMADKTSFVGNRTDPMPQAGRAVIGALVGGIIARQDRQSVWLGAVIGGAAAVAATHRLPVADAAAALRDSRRPAGGRPRDDRRGHALRETGRSRVKLRSQSDLSHQSVVGLQNRSGIVASSRDLLKGVAPRRARIFGAVLAELSSTGATDFSTRRL